MRFASASRAHARARGLKHLQSAREAYDRRRAHARARGLKQITDDDVVPCHSTNVRSTRLRAKRSAPMRESASTCNTSWASACRSSWFKTDREMPQDPKQASEPVRVSGAADRD